jgi:tetratricopeptide (TPR) repeat protein
MREPSESNGRSVRRWHILAALVGASTLAIVLWRGNQPPPVQDAAGLVHQALADLERGQTDSFARAVEAFDNRPEYQLHLRLLDAALFLHGGRIEQSLQELATIPPAGEFHRPVLFYTARGLLHQNRAPQAEALLRELATRYPDDVDVHRWLGILYYDLGAYDPAIESLQRVAELAPHDYRPHRLIGLMCRDFERTPEAIEHYQKALQRDPPADVRREIVLELAQSHIDNLQYDQALQHLDEIPDGPEAKILRARCLHSTNRTAEAEQLVQEVLEQQTDDRDALLLQAQILREQGYLDAALQSARRITDAHPYHPEGWYQSGLILAELEQTSQADAAMQQWQHLKDLHTRLTELNVQALGRPYDAPLRDQIAALCDQLGKTELADRWRIAAAACRANLPAAAPQPSTSSSSDRATSDDERGSSGRSSGAP